MLRRRFTLRLERGHARERQLCATSGHSITAHNANSSKRIRFSVQWPNASLFEGRGAGHNNKALAIKKLLIGGLPMFVGLNAVPNVRVSAFSARRREGF